MLSDKKTYMRSCMFASAFSFGLMRVGSTSNDPCSPSWRSRRAVNAGLRVVVRNSKLGGGGGVFLRRRKNNVPSDVPSGLEICGNQLGRETVAAEQRRRFERAKDFTFDHVLEEFADAVARLEDADEQGRKLVTIVDVDSVTEGSCKVVVRLDKEIYQARVTILKGDFVQLGKLGALVENIGEHLHEGRSRLRVLVVAHAQRVLETRVHIGIEHVGHGQDGVVAERDKVLKDVLGAIQQILKVCDNARKKNFFFQSNKKNPPGYLW